MSRFLFDTLLIVVSSSLGLVRCVIFYFLKPFVMKRILSSELSFFSAEVLVVYEISEFFLLEPGFYVPCEVTLHCFMVDEFFL